MLRTGILLGCVTALVSLGLASACTGTTDDCLNTSTCPPTSGASSGGGAGKAGVGGTSGSSSGGSTSGDAGETTGGTTSGGGSGTAGMAGGGGAGGAECDTTKSPTEEACLVSDDYAIFIAPDGDDGNAGSKDAPLASLTKAVEVAAGDKIILVCSGSYDEHVSIAAGAHIFGGFKCTDWSADTAKPTFKPTTGGPALVVDTVADELILANLNFEVGDATVAGETALTAIVNASLQVTLRAVSLKAGKGKAAANGTITDFTFPEASSLNGNSENPVGSGGAAKSCTCQPTLSSTGGLGGSPVAGGQNGSDGLPGLGGGAAGDHTKACNSGGGGGDGDDAPNSQVAEGASKLGTSSASGWQPAPGVDGSTGQPGQGGGGGASRNDQGHGGGGGCGGCGGNGGTAGKGGGGSIALLAMSSPVLLESSILTTADAGNGGNGAAGQAGQNASGGGGGTISTANSCAGGTGGKGGAGGAGGGGAGGVSAGVVWKGAVAPTVSADTTITIGKAGTKGVGGVPADNDGIAGVAQKVLPLN